jgi:hypothetical protein
MAKKPTQVAATVQQPTASVPTDNGLDNYGLPTLLTAAKISEIGQRYKESGVSRQTLIDQFMFQALRHFHNYGDTVFMTQVINDAAKGDRHQSMKEWFGKYSPCKWHEGENGAQGGFKKNGANGAVLFMDDNAKGIELLKLALANPYYKKPEVIQGAFSLEAMAKALSSIDSKFKKARKEGRLKPEEESAMIRVMQEIRTTLVHTNSFIEQVTTATVAPVVEQGNTPAPATVPVVAAAVVNG